MTGAAEMPFLDHLGELRRRLISVLLGVGSGTVLCFIWADDLFVLLTLPIRGSFAQLQLIGTGPADAFLIKLQISCVGGIFCSLPWSCYQLWRFVSPGLHEHERRLAVPFVLFSSAFFLGGAGFCFTVVLPLALRFFSAEYASIDLAPQIRIAEYLSFTLRLLLVFGVMFELPVLSYLLARLKLISSQLLRRQYRMAVLFVFVLAGILTPPDVVSQLLLAGPLLALYGLCILVCRYVERQAAGSEISPDP